MSPRDNLDTLGDILKAEMQTIIIKKVRKSKNRSKREGAQ